MLEVFRIFGLLRAYVDDGSPGRPWNLATMMLLRGDAAFQFIGDWAKSEIRLAGIEPGAEIGCALAPSPDVAYIMAVDAFALSTPSEPRAALGQRLFLRVALDRKIQVEFNRIRGSIPARLDVPDTEFDACARYAMQVIADPGTQLESTGLFGLSGGMSGAIDDAISQFWNDPGLTAEQGRTLFQRTVLAFR